MSITAYFSKGVKIFIVQTDNADKSLSDGSQFFLAKRWA